MFQIRVRKVYGIVAERAGFEPAIPVARDTGFRNRRFQPLSHLSTTNQKTNSSHNCKSPLATTYFPTPRSAVSSALRRFTSVFGMGTGGSIALLSPKGFAIFDCVSTGRFGIDRQAGSGGRIRTCDLRVMSPTSCHCSTPRRSKLVLLRIGKEKMFCQRLHVGQALGQLVPLSLIHYWTSTCGLSNR